MSAAGVGRALIVLVLVAVLPLLLFGGGVAWMIVEQKKTALADELGSLARALSVAVDHELASQISTMEVLATANSLSADRLTDFQERAQRALNANDDWLNVGLIDPHSHQIITGAPAVRPPLPTSISPRHVDEVVRTRKPVIVGTFSSGKITKGPMILLMIPVIHSNEVRYVLGVAVNPKTFSGVFVGQQLAASWTGAIVDANMKVAGRSRDPEHYIGRHVSSALADSMAARERGMFSSVNLEGTAVYTVYSRSPVTNWSVAIGVPAPEVDGPIQRTLLQLGAAGGTLIAFALILTGWVGRVIVRRRNAYERALQEGQAQLTERMQELNTILDNSSVGITFVRDRKQILSNRRMSDMLGYSVQEMENQSTRMFYVSQASYEELGQKGYDCLARGERYTTEQVMQCKDGSPIWMRISGNLIDHKNPASGSIWVFEDITERKQADQQLRIAATAFEAQEGMVVTDVDNVILRVNRAFTDITGYTAEEVVGHKMSVLKSGYHQADFYAGMWQSLQSSGAWKGEIWSRRKNGEVYPEWLTITAVKDATGVVAQYVGTLTDITLRKAAEDEVKLLAFYDPLTQLPNRRLLLNRLQQALVVSARTKRLGALLFIDLDNFKMLNDTLGHDVGDRLLQQVAGRLAACVRACDTVARLGGDEFVIMLEDLSETPLEAAAQTETVGHKILEALNQPYSLAAQPYHCTASVGATLFSEQQNSVDDLMKRADLAMYESKAAGRNTLRFFDPQMQADVTARATLEADLRRGLQAQEFRLYYQCQVDETGRVTGAEALVRWQHPQHGLMSPAGFIGLAEETGLILPLGLWVLETACQQLLAWAVQPATTHLSLAVNVSAVQFRQPDFVAQVLAVVQRSGVNPKKLKLELTESLLLENVEDIIAKMIALKAWGIGFALDDFGTGYSSLSYLKRLPLDQLKIDQTFVRDLLTDPNDAVIAHTIVALGQSLGLSVIAEGVETQAQQDCLATQGCSAYQGYLFGRPLPLEAFEALLKPA